MKKKMMGRCQLRYTLVDGSHRLGNGTQKTVFLLKSFRKFCEIQKKSGFEMAEIPFR